MLLKEFPNRERRRLLKTALLAMRENNKLKLGNHVLCKHDAIRFRQKEKVGALNIDLRASQLSEILLDGIEILGQKSGTFPPESLQAPAYKEKRWRHYVILDQIYKKKRTQRAVRDEISLSYDYFNEVQGEALDELSIILDDMSSLNLLASNLEFDAPGGPIPVDRNFYITRKADGELDREVQQSRNIIPIKGPRQSGKSSLLIRGCNTAREYGAKVIEIDFDPIPERYFDSLDTLLLYLVEEVIIRALGFDLDKAKEFWFDMETPEGNIRQLLEEYILPQIDSYLIMAFDTADRILNREYCNDFFAMIRGWYNRGAYQKQFQKLNIILVISTEPNLLISNPNISPFNIKHPIYLEDFNAEQVSKLNQKFSAPLNNHELANLQNLLNGHPYLTHLAYYHLLSGQYSNWADLASKATSDQGPFDSHLYHIYKLILNDHEFVSILKNLKVEGNLKMFERLKRAGLVTGTSKNFSYRCKLYQIYFEERL